MTMRRLLVALSFSTATATALAGVNEHVPAPTINTKTLLFDGVYAPMVGELRVLSSPNARDTAHNYETYGAKASLQIFRVKGFASTFGITGQGLGSKTLEFYGPVADVIAFPEARFHCGLSFMYGKGRIRRFDDNEVIRVRRLSVGGEATPAHDPDSWDRYAVKVTETSAYAVAGVYRNLQITAGVSSLRFTDDSYDRFMDADKANENPSGYSFSLGFRSSML